MCNLIHNQSHDSIAYLKTFTKILQNQLFIWMPVYYSHSCKLLNLNSSIFMCNKKILNDLFEFKYFCFEIRASKLIIGG